MSNYQFPSFIETYPAESRKLKRIRQFIRFHFGVCYCRNEIKELMEFLKSHTMWQKLFDDYKFRFNPLLHKFCDQRFNKQQRLTAIIDSLKLFEEHFSLSITQKLLNENQITLFELDDIRITLQVNMIEPHEGYFALTLHHNEQWIYNASFVLQSPNKLLIASLQGTNSPNSQELIKIVTKKLHGIRPMYMIVYLFKLFAEHYQLTLQGIAHKNQAKYRFNDNTRLLFNYDEFWQENGGKLNMDGYWALNNEIERKSLEEIPSKKRSMYRKRYEMMDEISLKIKQLSESR